MNFSPYSKFSLTLGISAAAVIAIGVVGVILPLNSIKDLNAKIFEERGKLNSLADQEGYKGDLYNEVKQIEAYKNNIGDVLLDRNRILDFIIELEQIAKNSNNTHTLSLLDKKEEEDKIFFQVSSQASFKDLMKFLKDVENIHYHCSIEALNIQSKGLDSSAKDIFSASFVLKVNVK